MRIIVFGATGGTGRAVTSALVTRGHRVSAFARNIAALPTGAGLRAVSGDVMRAGEVADAMPGHDAVVVSLGNSQNPFARLIGARRTTPADVCTVGTRHILAAQEQAGIARIIVVSAFGIGNPGALPVAFKMFYRTVLREQMADKETQEALIKASDLDWTIVQPVGLTDAPATGQWLADTQWKMRKQQISRADVAAFLVTLVEGQDYRRQTVALSG